MSRSTSAAPELLPILSRGKHRSSRKGACFMEMASVLAGERWTDHPKCTHPLLGEVARLVNDNTSDDERSKLALLIPAVVGLNSDDPRMDARIAHRCAVTALPIVSAERQNALAVAVLTADCVLAELDGRRLDALEKSSEDALNSAPSSAEWGLAFVARGGVSTRGFRRIAAPTAVRIAVHGIAEACVRDPDTVLRQLLTDVIADCERLVHAEASAVTAEQAPAQAAEPIDLRA